MIRYFILLLILTQSFLFADIDNFIFSLSGNKYGGGSFGLGYVFEGERSGHPDMGTWISGLMIEDKLFQRYNSISIGYGTYGRLLDFIITGYSIKFAYLNAWESDNWIKVGGYYGIDIEFTYFWLTASAGIFNPIDETNDPLYFIGLGVKF